MTPNDLDNAQTMIIALVRSFTATPSTPTEYLKWQAFLSTINDPQDRLAIGAWPPWQTFRLTGEATEFVPPGAKIYVQPISVTVNKHHRVSKVKIKLLFENDHTGAGFGQTTPDCLEPFELPGKVN